MSDKIVSILKIKPESHSEECFPPTPAQAHLQTTATLEGRLRSLMHVIKSQLSLSMQSLVFKVICRQHEDPNHPLFQEALKWLHVPRHFNS